jgi:hypothetical protein
MSPRRSAQTPSFNVSRGQDAGGGGEGVQNLPHVLQALESVEKKRREITRMAAESLLEAMAS